MFTCRKCHFRWEADYTFCPYCYCTSVCRTEEDECLMCDDDYDDDDDILLIDEELRMFLRRLYDE